MVGALAILLAPVVVAGRAFKAEPAPAMQAVAPDHRWAHFVQYAGGLMSNDVWAIAATDRAIWVGTDKGVSRYDGRWVNFPAADDIDKGEEPESAYPGGIVLALAVEPDSSAVLAGTRDGRIHRWDGEAWSQVADLGVTVTSVASSDDTVYAGTETGVFAIALGGDRTIQTLEGKSVYALQYVDGTLYAGTDDGLWRLTGESWEEVAPDGADVGIVHAIAEIASGGLAAGTPDGVVLLDERMLFARHLPVSDELGRPALVQALADDGRGRLWAGTDGAGAYQFSLESYDAISHGQAQDANVTIRYVRDVTVDRDGSIWFATPTGVYRYQVGMWHLDVQGDSVADPLNHINDLLVASDGKLWIATGGGGVRVKTGIDEPETVYAVEQDVPSTVLVLEEDALGNIWAGSFYGLFRFVDEEWELPEINRKLPDLTVTSLLRDGDRLWIGTEGGLALYDVTEDSLETFREFAGHSIEALALDGQQRLWVGTKAQGAWVRDESGEWTAHIHDAEDANSVPANYILSGGLAPDWRAPEAMWALISREGLAHWDGEGWLVDEADSQIPVNLLWMLESEADPGRLWIGSEGGVTQFDGKTWGTLSQDDGLQSASAYAIARSEDGAYWIGGATGLTHYRPDKTPPWVEIEPSGDVADLGNGMVRVPVGEDLSVTYSAGDLQTLQHKLHLMRRIAGAPDELEWTRATPGSFTAAFPEAGMYELQIVARDQSFNYSEVARLPIEVFVPPPTVDVPGLGPVDPSTFAALVILGSISVLGAGYILFEVLLQRRRSVEALNRGFNPYISGEPVRTQEMFFGRRELVQRMVDMLHNNSVMIHGERRIGKTTLLFQLATALREVEDPDYWFVPVYVDLEGTPQHDFFHLLIEETVLGILRLPHAKEEILPHLQDLQYRTVTGAEYDDRSFHRDLHQVIDVLDEYGRRYRQGKQLRIILLLDEMDVMSRYDSIIQQQMRRIFMREFAWTVGAVVAGIRISKDWDRVESPWYNMFNEIALEPFTDEDAQALLIEPVAGYYRYDDDALDFILDKSAGRPYRVQQYGLEAVNQMLARRRRTVRLSDAQQAHERIVSIPDRVDLKHPGVLPAQDSEESSE